MTPTCETETYEGNGMPPYLCGIEAAALVRQICLECGTNESLLCQDCLALWNPGLRGEMCEVCDNEELVVVTPLW